MTYYLRIEWPEYQLYMEHERFKEDCYYDSENNTYFIPTDIIDEVDDCTEFEGEKYYYSGKLKKGSTVLFVDKDGNYVTSKCVAVGGAGLPPLFEDNITFSHDYIGVKDE